MNVIVLKVSGGKYKGFDSLIHGASTNCLYHRAMMFTDNPCNGPRDSRSA
jgi:hypothetical protein